MYSPQCVSSYSCKTHVRRRHLGWLPDFCLGWPAKYCQHTTCHDREYRWSNRFVFCFVSSRKLMCSMAICDSGNYWSILYNFHSFNKDSLKSYQMLCIKAGGLRVMRYITCNSYPSKGRLQLKKHTCTCAHTLAHTQNTQLYLIMGSIAVHYTYTKYPAISDCRLWEIIGITISSEAQSKELSWKLLRKWWAFFQRINRWPRIPFFTGMYN